MKLYRGIQRLDSSLAEKVLFITGDVMWPDTRKFLAETKAVCIEKPLDAERLSYEVQRALNSKR